LRCIVETVLGRVYREIRRGGSMAKRRKTPCASSSWNVFWPS